MFCMSNKRDFHIIMVTMLSDLSAQDFVLQEDGGYVAGEGVCRGALGVFLLGTVWFLSPD